MLRGLEMALKNLWDHLIQEASIKISSYSGKTLSRFSNSDNVIAEIENVCEIQEFKLEESPVADFLKNLADLKTYTGEPAQRILHCLLETTKYLMSQKIDSESFERYKKNLLSELAPSSSYSDFANVTFLRSVTGASNQGEGVSRSTNDDGASSSSYCIQK